ncbi:MAG: ornithine cyclodeaminase family protein [Actinobacteria bacterium]|nr:MAG: ornithine cyclodeaminase family protein [Actinomycetota bacterium]
MLVISRDEVRALLDLDALIDALAVAMSDLSAGRASVPTRIGASAPERDGILAAMPGYVPSLGALTAKLVTLFPHNSDLPTHQAVILSFDPQTGQPIALMDGTEITAVRTGAGSALSARLLAREDASVLAILGTGVQARSHARAMVRVRPIREIRVAGRDPAKARAVADELSDLGADVHATASYEEASLGADIVCATTHAPDPVVRRAWLSPGAHVTSVGFNPNGREVDDETIVDASVCVESRAAILAPLPAGSNDLIEPIRAGVIGEDHIQAEIGELVLGSRAGRTSDEQTTLYKSVGVAVQDAAAASLVLAAAREQGAGRELEI